MRLECIYLRAILIQKLFYNASKKGWSACRWWCLGKKPLCEDKLPRRSANHFDSDNAGDHTARNAAAVLRERLLLHRTFHASQS